MRDYVGTKSAVRRPAQIREATVHARGGPISRCLGAGAERRRSREGTVGFEGLRRATNDEMERDD